VRKNEQRLSVVHINTHDAAGGAAKVAWRLTEAQRNAGHNSRLLVGYKKSNSEHSFLFPAEADPSARAQCRNEGQLFYEFQGSHKLINNPLVRSADILHLHNLHGGYFNPFSISALSHLRPVVWTLHDMQSITGHCAHSFDCQEWQSGCRQCPHLDIEPAIQIDTSPQLLSDKKLIYDHSYLWLVTPSQWLKSKVEKSILQGHPVELIYNGVDTTVFKPCDKKEARKKFGIAENVLVIGAVAHGGALTNQWKGGKYTQAALDALAGKFPDYVFVNIGGNFETDEPRIVNIPHVDNESELAQAYSTLDIFLNTSIADNCPLVILEALSCGIPIVSFATGGIPELVCDGKQGRITACGDQQELVQALYQLAVNPQLQAQYSQSARERAVSRFDFKIISEQYENLYRNILEESKTRINNVKLFPSSKVPKIIMSRAFIESENSKSNAITPEAKPAAPDADSSQTEYDVSIVLCTKDRAPMLDQMLASLSDAIQGISCEIIVVDGGGSDNTLEVLKRHGVTKIYNEAECLGPGRHSWPQLYNFAFAKARGKWAMYASDDIIFSKGCITQAVKSLNQQTDEVAGGIFFYKNLHEKSSVEKFYTGKYFVGFSCGQKLIMNYGLLRIDYFREVGGLDERYRFYCADGDLCMKLYESGKQLVPLPQCFVIHNNVLDMQKKSSEEGLKDDDNLYRQRWRHFVSADDPNPRRLLWQPDFVEAFALPAALRPVDSGIEYFWHGIACLQRGMFKMALEKFAQTMRTSCRHWVVLWYSAKAAYGCGNFEVAKKAAQMVVKFAPEFNQAQQFLAGLDGLNSTLQIRNTSADLPKFGLNAEVKGKPRKIYCVLFDTMPLLDEVVSLAKENAMALLRQVGGCFTTTSCVEMLTGKLCSDLEKKGMGYERHNRYRDPVTNEIHWPWQKELIVNRFLDHGWQVSLHNSVYFSTVLSNNPAFEKTTSLPGGLQAEKEFWDDKKTVVETILGDGPQSERFYQDEIRHIHQIQLEKPAKDKFYFVKYDQFHVADVEKSGKDVAARRSIELMKQWDFNEPDAMFWFFSDHGDWRTMGEHPEPDHYLAWVMFRDNTADAVEAKSRFIFAVDFFATIMNKFGYRYEFVSDARSVQQPQDTDRIYYTEDGRERFDKNNSTTAIACRFTDWDKGRPSALVQVSYFKPRNEFVCLLAHLNADGFVTNTVRTDKIDECLKQALVDRFEWVNESPTLSQAGDTQWMKNIRICQDTPDIDNIGFDNCDPQTNGEYALIPYLIKPGDIVFDVGANKGTWSRNVLSTVSPVRIYSFEPVADTFAVLKDNLGDSEASLHNVAISDSDGEKTFFYYNQSSQSAELSSFYRRSFSIEQRLRIKPIPIPVQSRTLDSFCKEHLISHIDFLKIDTEGGELDVLKGAVGLLREFRIRKLQFEYGGTYPDAGITLRQVCQLLSSYGYTIFRVLPDGLVHMGRWHGSLENNVYSNYLVVSPEQINDYGPMKGFSDSKTGPDYKAKAGTVPQADTMSQLEAAGLWRQGQPLRLHLGCGSQRLDGYINIDYPPDKHTVVAQLGADFYADITKLGFPAQSVDEIRLHHVFEHFNRGAALGLLAQWQQWLKIGAKLHIETPDALGCAKMLASNISYKVKQGILRHMFGSHEAEWAYHYDGWYDEKFQKTLSSLGFEVTCHTSQWQHEPYLTNVKAVAIKRRNLSREQLLVVCDRLLLDSMVADVPAERRMYEIWCQQLRAFQNEDVPVQPAQQQHHLQSSDKQCSTMFTADNDLSDFNSSCSEEVFS